MSKDIAFLAIYPKLTQLTIKTFRLWETIWNFDSNLERANRVEVAATSAGQPTMYFAGDSPADLRAHLIADCHRQIKNQANEIDSILKETPIGRLDTAFVERLNDALGMIEQLDEHEPWIVAQVTGLANDAAWQYLEDTAKSCLGDWGAWFLKVAAAFGSKGQCITNEEFDKLLPIEFRSPTFDIAKTLSEADVDIYLDEDNFAVTWGERSPCVIGNNQMFRFLKVLWDSGNMFVPFTTIAERMGGDSLDTKGLSVIKFRLVQKLKDFHYDRIADSIRTEDGHYGLSFD